MTEHQTLRHHLHEWANADQSRQAVESTVNIIADACCAIGEIIALGPLAGNPGMERVHNTHGDVQKELDIRANEILIAELRAAPVAYIASAELEEPVALRDNAPLYVAFDPLDGASNIDTNVSVGSIFSVMPMRCAEDTSAAECFLQRGTRQLAAGYVIYGPQTALVISLGVGTHVFTLNPDTGEFCLTRARVKVPEETHEFAINSSNFRRWDGHIRAYIDDCLKGMDGPSGKNYNMRWIASLVAESHRIISRGGIFLYPGDRRPDYQCGRLRLTYECNPIAFLMEQAGGAASTGHQRVLEMDPGDIHQRVPMIFGSRAEVSLVEHYYREHQPYHERSALFGNRGLFKV